MHPTTCVLRLTFCILAICIASSIPTHAAEPGWPAGYSIEEDSISPNGKYGVLIPSRDAVDDSDLEKTANTLVDLKAHRRLAVIRGVHYFARQNHFGLNVQWAGDSSWCAVTYDARYGFGTITLVELKNLTQSDLGQHIQNELDACIARPSGGSGHCFGSARFRAGPGRTVLVRATGLTNPKALEQIRTDYALFLGTFDLSTHRWTRSDTRPIDAPDPFNIAFAGDLEKGTAFPTEESRLEGLDEWLNDVYGALRVILPAARFAVLKQEQRAWLKRYETTDSPAKKCELLSKRIKELQRDAWQ